MKQGLAFAEQLRDAIPQSRVLTQLSGASMKSQFKQADSSGATWACILGEAECESQTVTLKHLRNRDIKQQTLSPTACIAFLRGETDDR